MTPVLVVGVPRSGTTWVAEVLARAADAAYLHEPDNHLRHAYALRAKLQLGQRAYPMLTAGTDGDALRAYAELWRAATAHRARGSVDELRRRLANRMVASAGVTRASHALAGRARLVRAAAALAVPESPTVDAHLVVKSVYAPLAVEWIAERFGCSVLVVLRNPLNVLSSWVSLNWLPPAGPDPVSTLDPRIAATLAQRYGEPPDAQRVVARAAWLVGTLTCALDETAARHPGWTRVVHEELCVAPADDFPRVADAVGLQWSAAGADLLEEGDRPGTGYDLRRVAAELHDAWRTRLDDRQVDEARTVLDRLPLDVGAGG